MLSEREPDHAGSHGGRHRSMEEALRSFELALKSGENPTIDWAWTPWKDHESALDVLVELQKVDLELNPSHAWRPDSLNLLASDVSRWMPLLSPLDLAELVAHELVIRHQRGYPCSMDLAMGLASSQAEEWLAHIGRRLLQRLPIRVQVLMDRQLKLDFAMEQSTVIGRSDCEDTIPFRILRQEAFDKVVLTALSDIRLSRSQLALNITAPRQLKITNVGSTNRLRVDRRTELNSGDAVEVTGNSTIEFGEFAVRVGFDQ